MPGDASRHRRAQLSRIVTRSIRRSADAPKIDVIDFATGWKIDLIFRKWAKLGQSQRQLEDVAGILRMQGTLDRAYVERWIDELELRAQWEQASALAARLPPTRL